MNGRVILRQEVGADGQLHFYGENGNEVFVKVHPWRWRVLTVWIIAFSIAIGFALYKQRGLADNNRSRIADIQTARIESCRQTYEGIRTVFKLFIRPAKVRTARENKQITRFNVTINRQKQRCPSQATKGGG